MVRALMLLLAAAATLASCTTDDNDGSFSTYNETDAPITVVQVSSDGSEQVLYTVAPKKSALTWGFGGPCRDTRLVARDQSGAEVAHLDGPICGGSGWSVKAEPVPSP